MKNKNGTAEQGYGYNLTAIIRENLTWMENLPLARAQEIAAKIADDVVYGHWIYVEGRERQRQFNADFNERGNEK